MAKTNTTKPKKAVTTTDKRPFEGLEDNYPNGTGMNLPEFLCLFTDKGRVLEIGGKPLTLADARSDLEWILSDLDEAENEFGVDCPLKDLV